MRLSGPKHETFDEMFVSERSVTLWSSVAQVREAVGILHYGDRVDVLARRNDTFKVRTTSVTGWVNTRYLMEPALWQRSVPELLVQQTRADAVQARGRTGG